MFFKQCLYCLQIKDLKKKQHKTLSNIVLAPSSSARHFAKKAARLTGLCVSVCERPLVQTTISSETQVPGSAAIQMWLFIQSQ